MVSDPAKVGAFINQTGDDLDHRAKNPEDGVGIHGTAEEESIGSKASHGCIRMRVKDVKQLFEATLMKTPVHVS